MSEPIRPHQAPSAIWVDAGPIRRFWALLYDTLPLTAVLLLLNAIAVGLNGGEALTHPVAKGVNFALMLLTVSGYFVYSWKHGGQTLGMRAWKLYLHRDAPPTQDQPAPDWRGCWRRCLAHWGCLLLFGVDWVIAVFTPSHRTAADYLSKSRIRRRL